MTTNASLNQVTHEALAQRRLATKAVIQAGREGAERFIGKLDELSANSLKRFEKVGLNEERQAAIVEKQTRVTGYLLERVVDLTNKLDERADQSKEKLAVRVDKLSARAEKIAARFHPDTVASVSHLAIRAVRLSRNFAEGVAVRVAGKPTPAKPKALRATKTVAKRTRRAA